MEDDVADRVVLVALVHRSRGHIVKTHLHFTTMQVRKRTSRELLQPPDLVTKVPDQCGLLRKPLVLFGELSVSLDEQIPNGREFRPQCGKAGISRATCFRIIHVTMESENESGRNP